MLNQATDLQNTSTRQENFAVSQLQTLHISLLIVTDATSKVKRETIL